MANLVYDERSEFRESVVCMHAFVWLVVHWGLSFEGSGNREAAEALWNYLARTWGLPPSLHVILDGECSHKHASAIGRLAGCPLDRVVTLD